MDYLIGDFTIQSGDDPAVFETTFPRAVNLDEGLEIAIKSIAFGPIKNLLYPTVKLSNSKKEWPLHLADRFYESQADILLEIHRQVLNWEQTYGSKISKFVEKNNELNLELIFGFYLEFHEDMFLNRPFKYKSHEGTKNKREIKYSVGKKTVRGGKRKDPKVLLIERVERLEKSVATLERLFAEFKRLRVSSQEGFMDGRFVDETSMTEITSRNDDLRDAILLFVDEEYDFMREDIGKQNEQLDLFRESIAKKEAQLDEILANIGYGDDGSGMKLDVNAFTEEVKQLIENLKASKAEINSLKVQTDNIQKMCKTISENHNTFKDEMESEVSNLKRSIEQSNSDVMHVMSQILDKMGYDDDQIIASDTTNYSTSTKDKLYTTKVTVSKTIIPSFQMGFLYGDMIERSWLNNQETRLMTTIPLKCQRGYNYYEFKNPVYKSIRVLKFDRLFFYILDKNGSPMKFNLFGDGKNDNKEFPTILNFHVRSTIKGAE